MPVVDRCPRCLLRVDGHTTDRVTGVSLAILVFLTKAFCVGVLIHDLFLLRGHKHS
jgi:hypothetical protein